MWHSQTTFVAMFGCVNSQWFTVWQEKTKQYGMNTSNDKTHGKLTGEVFNNLRLDGFGTLSRSSIWP